MGSKELLCTRSSEVNACLQIASNLNKNKKGQDCSEVKEDSSLSWCEEYYAMKADRRASIARSRLREGKTLQWRSNKHHRKIHQGRSWKKPTTKGCSTVKLSWRPCATLKSSLPRRAYACDTICPLDLEWGYEHDDDHKFFISACDLDCYSCCDYDAYDDFFSDECQGLWKFADEYNWWKEDRSAKIAKSRLGRRVPKILKASGKSRMKACSSHHGPDKVLLTAASGTGQAAQRLSHKHATWEHMQWQEVWSAEEAWSAEDDDDEWWSASISECKPDVQNGYDADAPDQAPKASVANLGCWIDLLLL